MTAIFVDLRIVTNSQYQDPQRQDPLLQMKPRRNSTIFTGKMFLHAKAMGNPSGVPIVRTGSRTEHITAEKSGGAFEKWTISAPGQFTFCVLVLVNHLALFFLILRQYLVRPFLNKRMPDNIRTSRVGGVVSETSFKFFVQFVAFAAIFCIFTLTVMAIVISEQKKEVGQLCLP